MTRARSCTSKRRLDACLWIRVRHRSSSLQRNLDPACVPRRRRERRRSVPPSLQVRAVSANDLGVASGHAERDDSSSTASDELEQWLGGDQPKTLGSIIELFGARSFALIFVLLMALSALPLPTGGATHVLEAVTMLVALELVVGRRCIWLPARWKKLDLAAPSRQKLVTALLRRIRWFERFSRPRASRLFEHRVTRSVVGALVFGLTLSAFLAPPFSGLDTLPSLGVVVLGLGVLLRDLVLAVLGALLGAIGVATILAIGNLVLETAKHLL
jgi:hypothetical protein